MSGAGHRVIPGREAQRKSAEVTGHSYPEA